MTRRWSAELAARRRRNIEMYRLYSEEGWSTQEVADEYGLNPGTVRRIFQKSGWTMRLPGGKGHRQWRLMHQEVT